MAEIDKHEYKAVQDKQSKTYKLSKDGIDCFCPKLQPLVMPGNVQGTAQIIRIQCNTGCPFAELIWRPPEETRKEYIYVISCETPNPKTFELSEVVSIEKLQPQASIHIIGGKKE